MLTYVVRRLLLVVVTVLGVMTILFALQRLSGDPTLLLLPAEASETARAALIRQLGLDRPLPVQYASFVLNALSLDLGPSWKLNAPAIGIVLEALPATLLLAGSALGLGFLVAVSLGIPAAIHRDS